MNSFADNEFILPIDLKLEMIVESESKFYKSDDGEQWIIKVDKLSSDNKIALEKLMLNTLNEKVIEFERQTKIKQIEIKKEKPNELLSEFKRHQSVDQGSLFLMGIEGRDGVTGKLSTHIRCDAYWSNGVHMLIMISWDDSNHKKFHDYIDNLSKLTLNSFSS